MKFLRPAGSKQQVLVRHTEITSKLFPGEGILIKLLCVLPA